VKLGFTNTVVNPHVYYLYGKSDFLVLVVYVDDMIITGSSKKLISWCKKLERKYDMKDIELMHYFLGLVIW
jgi:hypothetical protein